MGSIIDKFNSLFSRKADSLIEPSKLTAGQMLGGKVIMMEDDPRKYVEEGLVYNPDISAIINYIEKVAVRVPWVLKKNGEVIDNHPIYDIWEKGNNVSRGKHILGTLIKHYLTVGNAYLYGIAPEAGANQGKFMEFWNLPYDMRIKRGNIEPIEAYINPFNNKEIAAANVIHWKTSNPEGDGFYGTSPLKAGRLVLQQSNDSYLANAKSLQNLGIRGLLTRENLEVAGPEKAKQLSSDLQKMIGGADNFGKIPIAGGKYDYINFAVSPIDLQLLDAQLRSRQAICNIYGFPSELLNDKEASTYNNMKLIMKRLYTDVVIPLLEDMSEVFGYRWVKEWDESFEWMPDWSVIEALQDNKADQADWLSKAWWISAERKSEIMGEEPTVFGNFVPMNLLPDMDEVDFDEAIKQYKVEGTGEES